MKKLNLSLVTVLAMSTFAFAGGDIAPVEPMIETPMVEESTPGSFYLGLGYSYMNMNASETPEVDVTGNSVLLLAGYNFNQYIGLEGRYTMNVGDLTIDDGVTEDVSDDMTNAAIYVKGMYPVADTFNVYALLGYGETTYDNGIEYSEAGFQWGLGANVEVMDNVGVFVDYTRMYDDTGFDTLTVTDVVVDAISVGVTYTF